MFGSNIWNKIAVQAGATVIATTSSNKKVQLLKSMGATHVIKYTTNPDWGVMAKSLTKGGTGVDIVVDVSI